MHYRKQLDRSNQRLVPHGLDVEVGAQVHGIAALTVFLIGTTIAILCMSQVWWVGPIALAVGNAPFGTDISWELALGVTIVLYVPARWLERRMTGF